MKFIDSYQSRELNLTSHGALPRGSSADGEASDKAEAFLSNFGNSARYPRAVGNDGPAAEAAPHDVGAVAIGAALWL